MQAKSIDGALLALRKQIRREKRDGLANGLAVRHKPAHLAKRLMRRRFASFIDRTMARGA